jgi:hypothetical protein
VQVVGVAASNDFSYTSQAKRVSQHLYPINICLVMHIPDALALPVS